MYKQLDNEAIRRPGRLAVLTTQYNSGVIAYQSPETLPTLVKFCPEHQYFSFDSNSAECMNCPADSGTIWFQQKKCISLSDMMTDFGGNKYVVDTAQRLGYKKPEPAPSQVPAPEPS